MPDFFVNVNSVVTVTATEFNDCVNMVFPYPQNATHVLLDILYGTGEDKLDWTDAKGQSGYGRACKTGNEAVYCPLSVSRTSKGKAYVGYWTAQRRILP